jgi:ABC-type molybdate transport system substrate-binding protein
MFLSADEQLVFDLAAKGFTVDDGTLYAVGRIVIIAPHGSPLKADGSLADLKAALADGRVKKFAIANPAHAPYGRRAEEALRHLGLWKKSRTGWSLARMFLRPHSSRPPVPRKGHHCLFAGAVAGRVETRDLYPHP